MQQAVFQKTVGVFNAAKEWAGKAIAKLKVPRRRASVPARRGGLARLDFKCFSGVLGLAIRSSLHFSSG